MNRRFTNLLQAFLDLFKNSKKNALTQEENKKFAYSSKSSSHAAVELGMDVLPFMFEEAKTAPEREVDFLIENNQADMIFKYMESGYKLNKKQIFNMFQDYTIGIHIRHSYQDVRKKFMIDNYSGVMNELITEVLRWSEKINVPSKALLPNACTHSGAEKFLAQKLKGYNFLEHVFEYIPEVYQDTLDNFHSKQKIVEETIKNIPGYKVHQPGWVAARMCDIDVKRKLETLKSQHARLYPQVCAYSIDNLKSFIEEAAQYTNTTHVPTPNEETILLGHISLVKLKKLPLEAQTLLQAINSHALEIQGAIEENTIDNSILTQETFSFKTDIEQNLPQIIDKYLSITPREKENFKPQNGKTIDTLLFESLQSIHARMSGVLETYMSYQTNEKVKDLKASHQYLVSKKR